MKELSIEEKARRYDEAVKKLKVLHDDWAFTQNRAAKEVEEIFHELKESEDESIKKEIIDFATKANNGVTSILANNYNFNKWLAWLEKQGDQQKPTEDVDLPEFESYLCLMFQKFRAKGMCTNGEIIDYVKEHSQKLRDILVNIAWSEEDEKKLLCICAWIKDYPRIADFKDEMYTVANNYVDWLKSLRPQNTWKPSDGQISLL